MLGNFGDACRFGSFSVLPTEEKRPEYVPFRKPYLP